MPAVLLPDQTLARVMGVFRGAELENMYVQFWNGERWGHDPNDEELTVPLCMTCPPVDEEELRAQGIPTGP